MSQDANSNETFPQQRDILEEIKSSVASAKETAEEEYNHPETENSWIECFESTVEGIRWVLSNKDAPKKLSPEDLTKAHEILDNIKPIEKECKRLHEIYPSHDSIVPEEIKNYLTEMLKMSV